ncbi:UNVERIFIED_CONTAM: hypothetical protein GTU68_012455 [Idotea baltica]|nr:hypothetical protein [Idotea baltica]
MGALHDGHASLIRKASKENEIRVVSIFVNPTQFGPNEDLDAYPRTLEEDQKLCKTAGATHIYAPAINDIYPEGRETFEIQFGLRSMDKILCGAKRPGHFDGVLQVVSKLFNIVRPHKAYFGKKDFQQLSILETLGRELFFPVEVIGCPIIREEDGLAMSSRNRYLNPEERKQALFLSQTLAKVHAASHEGALVADLQAIVREELEDQPHSFMAAFCGATRLIDNLSLWE